MSPPISPLIGVTTYGLNAQGQYHLYANYLEAVRLAGGIPVLLTPGETQLAELCDRLDGIIFTGGGDINPGLYGGQTHPMIYSLDDQRDGFELTLARQVLEMSIPILGICRGLQTLHLASQGEPLIPHVLDYFDGSIVHRQEPPDPSVRAKPVNHRVQVTPDSRLVEILQSDTVPVVSWHHQAIPTVPPGWIVGAQAADGLIEAIEHQHHPWALAVQWHPEMSIEDDHQLKLFQALIKAAQTYRLSDLQW